VSPAGMEQVFFRVHARLVSSTCVMLSRSMRRTLECCILLFALWMAFSLIWLHCSFVESGNALYNGPTSRNCLADALNNQGNPLRTFGSSDQLLMIHISRDWDHRELVRGTGTPDVCFTESRTAQWLSDRFDRYLHRIGLHLDDRSGKGGSLSMRQRQSSESNVVRSVKSERTASSGGIETSPPDCMHMEENLTSGYESDELLSLFGLQQVYLFSFEKGYLLLDSDLRASRNITTHSITISQSSIECFGRHRWFSWLIRHFVGYDNIIVNWAITTFGGHGYLYNVYTKEVFNLHLASQFMSTFYVRDDDDITATDAKFESVDPYPRGKQANFSEDDIYSLYLRYGRSTPSSGLLSFFRGINVRQVLAFKLGIIGTTLFLFFTSTTLVSFTLRETQERMLKFTFLLQFHVSRGIPYAHLIFTHVVESLVFVVSIHCCRPCYSTFLYH
jgi:Tumour-associated protein